MDVSEYLNDHIEFAKKGRAVNWQEVAINVYTAFAQIVQERDNQIAELTTPPVEPEPPQ